MKTEDNTIQKEKNMYRKKWTFSGIMINVFRDLCSWCWKRRVFGSVTLILTSMKAIIIVHPKLNWSWQCSANSTQFLEIKICRLRSIVRIYLYDLNLENWNILISMEHLLAITTGIKDKNRQCSTHITPFLKMWNICRFPSILRAISI